MEGSNDEGLGLLEGHQGSGGKVKGARGESSSAGRFLQFSNKITHFRHISAKISHFKAIITHQLKAFGNQSKHINWINEIQVLYHSYKCNKV